MNNSLILYEVSIRSSDSQIGILSSIDHQIRNILKKFSSDQNWWYRRTIYLIGRRLSPMNTSWSGIYSCFKNGIRFSPELDYKNEILPRILLEAGADPIEIVPAMKRKKTLSSYIFNKRRIPSSYPLTLYCIAGNVPAVSTLLADPRVDPTVDNDIAFVEAYHANRTEIVHLLLKDGRIDPLTRNAEVISDALKRCHVNMLAVLLVDDRVKNRERR